MEGYYLRDGGDDPSFPGLAIWPDGRSICRDEEMRDVRFYKELRARTSPGCKAPGIGHGIWDKILLSDWIESGCSVWATMKPSKEKGLQCA